MQVRPTVLIAERASGFLSMKFIDHNKVTNELSIFTLIRRKVFDQVRSPLLLVTSLLFMEIKPNMCKALANSVVY
jgi:hypothetical protein